MTRRGSADPETLSPRARRSRRSSAPGSTASSPACCSSTAACTAADARADRRADARPVRRRRARASPPRRRRRRALARSGDADRRAHEARRRPAVAPAHDGGDGAAGLRPVRLQLRGLSRTRSFSKKEERLNLCVPGGKDTSRMLKKLYRRDRRVRCRRRPRLSPPPRCRDRAGRPGGSPGRSREHPAEATFRLAHAASTSRARRRRPGTSSSISPDPASNTSSATASASMPANDPGARRRDPQGARRAAGFSDRRAHVARGADRRRVAQSGAGHAVPAHSYVTGGERRQKAKALSAGEDPDGDAATLDVLAAIEKFPGRPSRSRGLRRGARSAAAAALFDLILAQCASRPDLAHGRHRALRDRQAPAPRRRLDLPCRARQARRHDQGLCAEGARISACPPILRCRSSWSAPAPASRRSAPSSTTAWRPRRPGRNWLFFGHQRRDCDFFYEDELAGMRAAGVLTRLYARVVARRQGEVLRPGPHAPGRRAISGMARRRRAYLRLRRGRAWARTSSAPWSTSSPSTARKSTSEAIAFVADLKKRGRYQADVY